MIDTNNPLVAGAPAYLIVVALVVGALWEAWRTRKAKGRTCAAYCPRCRTDLCATGRTLEDTDLVRILCLKCGSRTEWDFDAPAPILIRLDGAPYR